VTRAAGYRRFLRRRGPSAELKLDRYRAEAASRRATAAATKRPAAPPARESANDRSDGVPSTFSDESAEGAPLAGEKNPPAEGFDVFLRRNREEAAARWEAIRQAAIARGEAVVADPELEGHVMNVDWWHA
jgi:hypothetical protein